MKKIVIAVIFMMITVLSVGCSETKEEVDLPEPFEFDYELIEEDDLTEKALIEWYELNKDKYGSYIYSEDEFEKYLLISAGERPTGGYSLSIVDVSKSDNVITFRVVLDEPSPDEMVTEALTYPNLLIEVSGNESFEVDAILEFDDIKLGDVQKNTIGYENIDGIYVGQIDNNFIEIDLSENDIFREQINIDENFLSLMLSDEAKEVLTTIESGDKVQFNCFQNENGTWIIEKFID